MIPLRFSAVVSCYIQNTRCFSFADTLEREKTESYLPFYEINTALNMGLVRPTQGYKTAAVAYCN